MERGLPAKKTQMSGDSHLGSLQNTDSCSMAVAVEGNGERQALLKRSCYFSSILYAGGRKAQSSLEKEKVPMEVINPSNTIA